MRPKRARTRRLLPWLGVVFLLALALSSLSLTPSVELTFMDVSGRPLRSVWVAYHYRGSRFNFVDSLSYERRGALAQTDAQGRLVVPGFVHVHAPLDGGLRPALDWVYSPDAHNLSRPWTLDTREVPGRFAVRSASGPVVLFDFTTEPELWSSSVRELSSVCAQFSSRGALRYTVTATQREALCALSAREHEAFMRQHGDLR